MPTTGRCSECGNPLAADGGCPICALKRALALSGQDSEAQVIEQAGDCIGRYKLLEKIGEGGYGVVYMAEQAEPIRRRVALKIVKLGMDTRQVIARFEAERQALALMDHPSIAKVLDAGATDTGRPYFVMELVRGIRITDYCDQHKLATRERLDLFIRVCHAVQHAHQKGIIHRDLKPSNVLVTELDGVAAPKVIDFGIAKATSQQLLTDKTVFTAFQQFIGTPAYMSPEQAGISGSDVDTRSDIYALGVLLYELLTSHVPFESKELLQAGFDQMWRLIREQEPPRPSTRLRTLPREDLTTVARHQRTEPPKLIHLVRGDLDWIVMKCLEKDRRRRYETASGLAHDIARHLDDEPVTAAGPSALYRLGKFMRRYRQGLLVALSLALLLMAGFVWQTVRVRRMERQARILAKFLENSLTGVRSSVAAGRDTTLLKEVVDQVSTRAESELKDWPAAQASVRLAMGFLYVDTENYPRAQTNFLNALETYERLYGRENPGVAAATFGLGFVSLKQGSFQDAEQKAGRAVATGTSALGSNHTLVGHSLNCLAAALEAQNKLDEAEAACRQALAIGRGVQDEEALMVANSLSTLGRVLLRQGRLVEAANVLDEAVTLRKRISGPSHPQTAELLKLLATALERQGRVEEAVLVLREARRTVTANTNAAPR